MKDSSEVNEFYFRNDIKIDKIKFTKKKKTGRKLVFGEITTRCNKCFCMTWHRIKYIVNLYFRRAFQIASIYEPKVRLNQLWDGCHEQNADIQIPRYVQ